MKSPRTVTASVRSWVSRLCECYLDGVAARFFKTQGLKHVSVVSIMERFLLM